MSTLNIIIPGGTTKRLPTAGKYCDKDIIITATGGGGNEACDKPHVYHVEGVENLPPDAMNGALAVVAMPDELLGTWLINEIINTLVFSAYNVSFSSNGINFESLSLYGNLQYHNDEIGSAVAYDNGAWTDEGYRTITINKLKDDYSKAGVLSWLSSNAMRVEETLGYTLYSRVNGEWISEEDENFAVVFDCPGDCVIVVNELPTENIDENAIYLCGGEYYRYIDGEWKQYVIEGEGGASNEEILSELMEWGVMSDSNSCIVSVYNYHSSKYLMATLYLYNSEGEEFEKEIVIAADEIDAFTFQSQYQSVKGWEVTIQNVRFSIDGT